MTFRAGNTLIGNFKTARDAAVFHLGTAAIISICPGLWMNVATGETVTIKEIDRV